MHALLITFFLIALSIFASIVLFKGKKIQTVFLKVISLFTIAGIVNLILVSGLINHVSIIAVLWLGVFLSWFGIRSHLESSILLRFIVLLQNEPLSGQQLVSLYNPIKSTNERLDELLKSGLVERAENGLKLTHNGKIVLSITNLLR